MVTNEKKVTETELIGDIREDVLFFIKRKYQREFTARTGFQWMANTVKDILDEAVDSVNQVNDSADFLGRMLKNLLKNSRRGSLSG